MPWPALFTLPPWRPTGRHAPVAGAHWRRGPPRIEPATPAGAAPGSAAAEPGLVIVGWFDSSHDLAHGLHVTEHRQPDEVARLVPLRWWLAWELDADAACDPSTPETAATRSPPCAKPPPPASPPSPSRPP